MHINQFSTFIFPLKLLYLPLHSPDCYEKLNIPPDRDVKFHKADSLLKVVIRSAKQFIDDIDMQWYICHQKTKAVQQHLKTWILQRWTVYLVASPFLFLNKFLFTMHASSRN